MKVLICLAFVGYTLASQAILTNVPAIELVPATKTSYEYSADVQTAQYQTHQSVKSNIADVAPIAPVVSIAPVETIAKVIQYSAPPAVVAAPFISQPIVKTASIVEPILTNAIVKSDFIATAPAAKVIAAEPTIFVSSPTIAATPVVEKVIAAPAPIATTVIQASPAIVAADKIQYHSQDSLGQAAYGHSEALQTHNAIQDITGSKAGSFSYVAPDGRLLTTDYVADLNGYRVASNAFPVAHSRRRRSLAYTAPFLPYAYTAGAYAPAIATYQPAYYSAPLVAVKPISSAATSTFVNHGDGLSQTHSFQLH